MRRSSFAAAALLALALARPARADDEDDGSPPLPAPNAVYVELGGSALAYSVNYERRVDEHVALRVGVGAWPSAAVVPFACYALLGGGAHHLELGLGLGVGAGGGAHAGVQAFAALPSVGYRYQPREGGFVFRLTGEVITFGGQGPFVSEPGGAIFPWLGLSLGRAF